MYVHTYTNTHTHACIQTDTHTHKTFLLHHPLLRALPQRHHCPCRLHRPPPCPPRMPAAGLTCAFTCAGHPARLIIPSGFCDAPVFWRRSRARLRPRRACVIGRSVPSTRRVLARSVTPPCSPARAPPFSATRTVLARMLPRHPASGAGLFTSTRTDPATPAVGPCLSGTATSSLRCRHQPDVPPPAAPRAGRLSAPRTARSQRRVLPLGQPVAAAILCVCVCMSVCLAWVDLTPQKDRRQCGLCVKAAGGRGCGALAARFTRGPLIDATGLVVSVYRWPAPLSSARSLLARACLGFVPIPAIFPLSLVFASGNARSRGTVCHGHHRRILASPAGACTLSARWLWRILLRKLALPSRDIAQRMPCACHART